MSSRRGGPSRPEENHPPVGWGRGPGFTRAVDKAKNPKRTLRRLLREFHPYRFRIALVVLAAILSTVFAIWSPKILGNATTVLFDGFIGRLRHIPGAHVDFHAIFHDLIFLAALYFISAGFSYVQQYVMAVVAQRLTFTLRAKLMEKLNRLPVQFFDNHPHGDVLSRFVNDFDNISSTLQQSLTQLITSIVTFGGVIIMMLTISPLMTLAVAATLPLSVGLTTLVVRRSQRYFKDQRRQLGELNGHVEEAYTGHATIKAYGREDSTIERFEAINRDLYQSSWRAQFMTGIIFPMMNVIGNLGYVLVIVLGGILVMRRTIQIGDIQAFIQYARHFSQPITLEWSLPSPAPAYNFALIPTVQTRDAWWEMKQKGRTDEVKITYETAHAIHMPKNSPMPIMLGAAFLIGAVGMVFSWHWLAILGGLGVVADLAYGSFADHTEAEMSAAHVIDSEAKLGRLES